MNTKSGMSQTPARVFFPDDLIAEILSLLSVKDLLRFKCVSHSWNSLISDSAFAKLHLKRSAASGNTHFTLVTQHSIPVEGTRDWRGYRTIIPYPITHLFDNPSATFVAHSHYLLNNDNYYPFCMAGSCNGLICLVHCDSKNNWFQLWNPTTRKMSQQFGYSHYSRLGFTFKFGFDDSTGTFKVVAYHFIPGRFTNEVKVFTIGDNVWKNIDSFPFVPLAFDFQRFNDGSVFLNSTLNWFAIHKNIQNDLHDEVDTPNFDYKWTYIIENITIEDLVIVSLDLRTETYSRYLLPQGFDELPPVEPTISVLGECLCFSYFHKKTEMVIWQMQKFGIEESWIQFLKISYRVLQLYYDFSYNRLQLLPLFLSKDGDSLILYSTANDGEGIIYNWKDNSAQKIGVNVHKTIIDDKNCNYLCLRSAIGYVETLFSIC